MRACVHECVYVCVFVYIRMHEHIRVCVRACMHVCVCVQPSELRSAFGNANLNADLDPQKVGIFLPTMYRWMVNVKS